VFISTSVKNSIVGIIHRPNTPLRANIDSFSTHLFDILELKTSVKMADFTIEAWHTQEKK